MSFLRVVVVLVGVWTVSDATIGGRIIGGQTAEPGQFPWMVGIYATTPDRTTFCGGALISEQYVITAGHCVKNATQFTVYLGSNSLVKFDENRVIIQTGQSYLHPDYSNDPFTNDLGLINLEQSVNFNDYIQPLKIQWTFFVTLVRPVYVSGWGVTADGSTTLSEELNFVNLQTLTNPDCKEYYGDNLPDLVICAIGDGSNTCLGDDGGPLVFYDLQGTPLLVGIHSFISSAGCSGPYPSGFTRINYSSDWIQQITGL